MSDLLSDPQEADPKFRRLLKRVELAATANVKARGIEGFGACHTIWAEMERILLDEHAIQWRSPSEMNPHVLFD